MMTSLPPRYPRLRVGTASGNPLALLAATRLALRRAGVPHEEIERLEEEARREGVQPACQRWVEVQPAGPNPPSPKR